MTGQYYQYYQILRVMILNLKQLKNLIKLNLTKIKFLLIFIILFWSKNIFS